MEPVESQLPKYHQLMWPTLEAIRELGGEAERRRIIEKVIERGGFTPQQITRTYPNKDKSILEDRIGWALSYLKQIGLLVQPAKSIYRLTEEGRVVNEREVFGLWKELSRKRPHSPSRSSKHEPNKVIFDKIFQIFEREPLSPRNGLEESNPKPDAWREELLGILHTLSPAAFERLCKQVLESAGFIRVEVTGRSGDGGIDGIGVLRLGLISFPVLFQSKRYSGQVSSAEIRNFRGAMQGRTDKGIFITTGLFSKDAQREATRDGVPPIDLIDGERLCDLLKEHKLGVRTRLVEQIDIDPAFFDNL